MALAIKYFDIEEKEVWNSFVSESLYGDILQFWQWGEAKSIEGWTPMYVGVVDEEDSRILLTSLVLTKKASFLGNYMYVGHGPVFKDKQDLKKALPLWKKALVDYAKKNKIFAIEIEPKICFVPDEDLTTPIISKNLQAFIDPAIIKIFDSNGFIKTKRNTQPKFKLYYDLDSTEEELLGLMKKNTRYNVKLAERKGVEFREYNLDDPEIDVLLVQFYTMLLETQERARGYPIRPITFFKRLLESFKGTNSVCIMETKYQGQVIAINISQRTKSWASSFYAASNRKFTEVKAPYLLRWKSVLSAKNFGSKVYDFWGIIPNSSQHKGYSENKLSFGGTRIDTYGLLALPINKVKFLIWDRAIRLRAKVNSIFWSKS
jgi:lipid II:glycine glycyltransferase (peptidoglycan interpeptide bridge formation enzyme)